MTAGQRVDRKHHSHLVCAVEEKGRVEASLAYGIIFVGVATVQIESTHLTSDLWYFQEGTESDVILRGQTAGKE